MKRTTLHQLVSLAVAGGAATLAPLATAQSATTIEEITVTARRTEESIQSVPVVVRAFDSAALREASISTPEDIQVNTPGVYLSGSGGRQNAVYQIRGQSKALAGPSSPAVVSYFAEVPDPVFGSFVPQYDMGSVQVLKGPQGTLFGRNTTGGAVLYSPAAPTYEAGGFLSGTLGNYDDRQLQGAVNLPLVADRVALRLAGDIHDRDAYTRNRGVGGDIDDLETRSWRASLLVEPVEGLTNLTIYDYHRSENGGFGTVITAVPSGPNLLGILGLQSDAQQALAEQRARGPYRVETAIDQFEENTRHTLVNRTEVDFGAVQLVNIFGYRSVDVGYATNADGMRTLVADGTGLLPAGLPIDYIKAGLRQEVKQLSNELQLRGKALEERLDWLVGAFWLKSEPDGSQGISVEFAQVPGFSTATAGYNFIDEESRALFAHLGYGLDGLVEGLSVEAGIRYTEDEVDSCTGIGTSSAPDGASDGDCRPGSANLINASTTNAKSDEVTWSLGLNWQITPDLFSYLVTRHGYRAGGVNGPSFSGRLTPLQTFAPETVTDVEIGVRSDWTIGTVGVRANASAFVGDYEDVQVALTGVQSTIAACNPASNDNPPAVSPDGDCDPNNDPAGGTLLVNIGESRVSGLDLELTVVPVENLSLDLGFSYLDTETRKYEAPPAVAPYVVNDRIPFNYTTDKTYFLGVRYGVPLSGAVGEELLFNLQHYRTNDLNYTDAVVPSYHLTNLRVDLRGIGGTGLDLGIFVRNLTDEEYNTTANASGAFIGMTSMLYGPPRMYGAQMTYSF